MSTSLLPHPERRQRPLLRVTVAAVAALAVGLGGIGALGSAASASGPAGETVAEAAPTVTPTVSVVKDLQADPTGRTVRVTGRGFDHEAAKGTALLKDKQAGAFVLFGRMPEVWEPSKGVPSGVRMAGRDAATQKWAVLAEDMGAITDDSHTGATELLPDGTFSTSIVVDRQFEGVPDAGNFGIYTYAGDIGNAYAPYETYTPILFGEDSDTFDIQAGVTVTPTVAADHDTLIVTGRSFDPAGVSGTVLLRDRPAGTFVLFGRFPDEWEPSKGIDSRVRKYDGSSRKWAVLAEDMDAITDDSHEGATELLPDGTFTTTVVVDRRFEGVPASGNFGIYTYAGDIDSAYAPYETYTPISDPFVDPTPGPTKPGKKATALAVKVTKKATRKKAGKVRVVVRAGKAGKARATGRVRVRIKAPGRKIVTRHVRLTRGKAVVKLPRAKRKGVYRVRATYAGNAKFRASKKVVTYRVEK